MSNPFSAIGHYFENLGKALFGQLKVSIAKFLHDFVQDDLGKLAIDAVTYASTLGLGGTEARAAAQERLIADLKAAGHDVVEFGESTLNFLIESALQKLKADAGGGILALGDTKE